MANDSSPDQRKFGILLERYLIPLCILGFCAVAFWLSTGFDRVPPILKRGIQPSDFPQLVIALIAFLAIVDLFVDRADPPERLGWITWLTIASLAGFALLAQIDLFIGLGAFAAFLAWLWGERRKPALLGIGIALPIAVFFLFDRVFEVRFPRGLLTSLWYG